MVGNRAGRNTHRIALSEELAAQMAGGTSESRHQPFKRRLPSFLRLLLAGRPSGYARATGKHGSHHQQDDD